MTRNDRNNRRNIYFFFPLISNLSPKHLMVGWGSGRGGGSLQICVMLLGLLIKALVRCQIVDTVSTLSRYVIPLCERVIRPQERAKGLSCKLEGSLRKVMGRGEGGQLNVETVTNLRGWEGSGQRRKVASSDTKPLPEVGKGMKHKHFVTQAEFSGFISFSDDFFALTPYILYTKYLHFLLLTLGKTCSLVLS